MKNIFSLERSVNKAPGGYVARGLLDFIKTSFSEKRKFLLYFLFLLIVTSVAHAADKKRSRNFQSELDLHKPASEWAEGDYVIIGASGDRLHLGPTGLWGKSMGQNLRVREVERGSPAHGKIKVGDYIYGVKGKVFPADRKPQDYLAQAITEAETEEAGGVLTLDIWRNGKLIQVPIQLEVMGSFSATTPYNCEKSDRIVAKAEEYMIRGLRPKTGAPNNNHYMYGPFNDSVLFLLASGNPKMQGLVRRYILGIIDKGVFNGDKGRKEAFLKLLFGEYYHRTGDPTVLPFLREMCARGRSDFSWPPQSKDQYGLYPHAHMAGTMGLVLADEAGVLPDKKKLWFNLKYLNVGRAEYGWVKYFGYRNMTQQDRQIDAPLEITAEHKATGSYSSMNGKLGAAAALFSMVDGYEKSVEMCATRCVYAFNRTHKGHGGIWYNGFWTPIGASHAGPEKFTFFMKGQQTRRELLRHHNGSIWQEGNAKGKKSVLGTGFAIHRAIPRKKLRMLGAPRSMFGPSAPAYMNEALAAHRNRDYALAEALTRKLKEGGVVPDTEFDRVNHFLDTVRTLKESIDHDLDYAEDMVKEGNYLMASIELPQLKMVTSPDNPRLQAIERALESNKDKLPDLEKLKEKGRRAWEKHRRANNKAHEREFYREVKSPVLIKDGAKIRGIRSRRNSKYYPQFGSKERTVFTTRKFPLDGNIPSGWEQPGFDDSTWEKTKLAHQWKPFHAALFRTTFHVDNPANIDFLRFRLSGNEHRGYYNHVNLSIYLNGKLVVKCAMVPDSMSFDLPRGFNHLLQSGKNTFAMRIDSQRAKRWFTLRLIAIKRDGAAKAKPKNDSPRQGAKTSSPKKQKPRNHHEEIELMLTHLKMVQPKIKVGETVYPGSKVHDYLAKVYGKYKGKVTSTDIFLEKIATKTRAGLIYVVDGKGGKTLLKDWLEGSLPRKK